MNVLHLYPQRDPLIDSHVAMLREGETPFEGSPDIVHVHGCWNYGVVRQAMRYHRYGSRIVLTPHGGLSPWVIAERRFTEKLSKTILWQRRMVESAYVMIAQGPMESEAIEAIGWNLRQETIRNAVVTNSITPEAMRQQTEAVYRKVMDSNTFELMTADTRRLFSLLLKVGITGDARWINEEPPTIDETEWRKLLVYADHENVRTTIDRGLRALSIRPPYIDTRLVSSYLPTDYQLPKVENTTVVGIVSEIHQSALTLRHLVELDRALRRDNVSDETLVDALIEKRLLRFFRRLLQLLTEFTLLDEGFLPAAPISDRATARLRRQLVTHLRI